jgi:hypothetical protein
MKVAEHKNELWKFLILTYLISLWAPFVIPHKSKR